MTAIFDQGAPLDLLPMLRKAGCEILGFPNKWKGTKIGQLMQLIESEGFTCLVTSDKNLQYQQNLTNRSLRLLSCRLPGLKNSRQLLTGLSMRSHRRSRVM